jgi:hypothetical protein
MLIAGCESLMELDVWWEPKIRMPQHAHASTIELQISPVGITCKQQVQKLHDVACQQVCVRLDTQNRVASPCTLHGRTSPHNGSSIKELFFGQ